jgi:hypothetical protein
MTTAMRFYQVAIWPLVPLLVIHIACGHEPTRKAFQRQRALALARAGWTDRALTVQQIRFIASPIYRRLPSMAQSPCAERPQAASSTSQNGRLYDVL